MGVDQGFCAQEKMMGDFWKNIWFGRLGKNLGKEIGCILGLMSQ